MSDKIRQTADSGIVICSKAGSFWNGFNWKQQLREAKIYHSAKFAQDIIDRHPDMEARLLPVEIRITDIGP